MALQKGKISTIKNLTEDVVEMSITTDQEFLFQAGQFITIKIEDQEKPCFRAYSISSAPSSSRSFDLCIKQVQGGRGSTWLCNRKEGEELTFMGPNGKFTFNSPTDSEILFIATGTGIAPLKSMIEDQLNKGNAPKMHLLFGVRHIKDIFYKIELENLTQTHSNFTFDLTLSQPEDEDYKGNKGRVTTLLDKTSLAPLKTHAYICGLNAMIESTSKILENKGVPASQIHFEKYD